MAAKNRNIQDEKLVTLTEVVKNLKYSEQLIISKEDKVVVVYDADIDEHNTAGGYISQMYKIDDNDPTLLEPIDVPGLLSNIADNVKDKIDIKALLMETLKTSNPLKLIEAGKRLSPKQPKSDVEVVGDRVRTSPGCYSIVIAATRPGQEDLEIPIRF